MSYWSTIGSAMGKLLKKLGFSPMSARPRHPKQGARIVEVPSVRSDLSISFTCGSIPRSSHQPLDHLECSRAGADGPPFRAGKNEGCSGMPSRGSCTEGGPRESISKSSWLSTSPRRKRAVAIAEGGRTGEVRFLGDVENNPLPIKRTIKRLAGRYDRLHICFEVGPTGYGLYPS
jgi:hypothetical protein